MPRKSTWLTPKYIVLVLAVVGIGGLLYGQIAHWMSLNQHYQDLERALQRQAWSSSDSITRDLALQLTGATLELTSDHFARLPCRDVLKIDRLWQTYSNDRFGFTPQHQLWLSQGGQVNRATDRAMAQAMGWVRPEYPNDSFDYPTQAQYVSLQSPPGHLPFHLYCCLGDAHKSLWHLDDRVVLSTLAQRYDQCLQESTP